MSLKNEMPKITTRKVGNSTKPTLFFLLCPFPLNHFVALSSSARTLPLTLLDSSLSPSIFLLSLGAKLLPSVNASAQQASSSSSSPPIESQKIEDELRRLMSMVNRTKYMLYDAEQREIRDLSVRNWLKELKEVALDAEDVLDEYHYEVLRAEVEARDSSRPFVLAVQKMKHLITEEFVNLGKTVKHKINESA